MPSLQSLRRKIAAFKNTQKITKAMKMVAAAKLKRAQEPHSGRASLCAQDARGGRNLSRRVNRDLHPLCRNAPAKMVRVIVVTSDRGLCGGFNANIVRKSAGVYPRVRGWWNESGDRHSGAQGAGLF